WHCPYQGESFPGRLRPAHHPDLSAVAPAAEQQVAAVRLQARHSGFGRHIDGLEYFAGVGIDAPELACTVFPGAMPQLVSGPAYTRNESVGFDDAKHCAAFRIDLVDFAVL